MKRAYISIDPGITTGWAVLTDPGGYLVATSNWNTENLRTSLDTLVRHLHLEGYTLTAIVERMPHVGRGGKLEQDLEQVRRDISHVLEETFEIPTVYVTPGVWKTSRTANMIRLPREWGDLPLTQHQRDAIRMGCYAIVDRARPHDQKGRRKSA